MKLLTFLTSLSLLCACAPDAAPTGSSASAGSAKSAPSPAASPSQASATPEAPKALPRTSGSVSTRDGKTLAFSIALPQGFTDRTPKELTKYSRMFAASDDFKQGYVIEIMGPNPLVKDAATLATMAEKQGAKVLRNDTVAGGYAVALEPKEGEGKLLLLHASVDDGRLYCRGNAAGAVTADATKAIDELIAICRSAKVEG